MLKYLLVFLFFSLPAHANELSFRSGMGAIDKQAQARYFSAVYRDNVHDIPIFIKQTELGYIKDPHDINTWSIFRSYGVELKDQWYFRALVGMGLVPKRGARLGGNFQFTQEIEIGHNYVGLGYKHISNAGIKKPNLGRDFLQMSINIPF
jgi:hypothetical protein